MCSMIILVLHKYFVSVPVTSLLRKLKQQSRETLESRRPALIQALKELGDFYLELKWDFQSWGKSFYLSYCIRLLLDQTEMWSMK